jgi:Transposase.
MEISSRDFRVMIFYDFRYGLTPKQCVEKLISVFGDAAPSKTMVYKWFAEFKRERPTFDDDVREGRPCTSVVAEKIDGVREMITADRHVTYQEIKSSLGIAAKQIHAILHDHLNVRKICSRWIPHNLNAAQKQARVNWCKEMLKKFDQGRSNSVYYIVTGDETWVYSYEPETKQQSCVWVFQSELKPTKVVRSRSVSKKMIACFFGKTGHVASVALEDRRTVNSDWYTSICLPEVIAKIRRNNVKRRIIVHHDNASAHTAQRTIDFLSSENIEIMTHCPYSPDLSPNDFFLFPNIKNKLRGKRFASPEEAVEAFNLCVSEVPRSEWRRCFEDWFHRMKKCIDLKGEYFEKQ